MYKGAISLIRYIVIRFFNRKFCLIKSKYRFRRHSSNSAKYVRFLFLRPATDRTKHHDRSAGSWSFCNDVDRRRNPVSCTKGRSIAAKLRRRLESRSARRVCSLQKRKRREIGIGMVYSREARGVVCRWVLFPIRRTKENLLVDTDTVEMTAISGKPRSKESFQVRQLDF